MKHYNTHPKATAKQDQISHPKANRDQNTHNQPTTEAET